METKVQIKEACDLAVATLEMEKIQVVVVGLGET